MHVKRVTQQVGFFAIQIQCLIMNNPNFAMSRKVRMLTTSKWIEIEVMLDDSGWKHCITTVRGKLGRSSHSLSHLPCNFLSGQTKKRLCFD